MTAPDPAPLGVELRPEPFSAALVPFPVEDHLPGLPAPVEVRKALGEQFEAAVARERERRGQVTRPADTWPMVRAVESFAALVDDYARVLTTVAKDARKVLEEELFEAVGEQDGIPSGPLNVPHAGSIISVKAKTDNVYDIDADQVLGALAALVSEQWHLRRDDATKHGKPLPPAPEDEPQQYAMAVAQRALVMVGAATLKVTHVKNLAVELGHMGADSLSATVTDAIRKRRIYKGTDVSRKADPKAPRFAAPTDEREAS